MNLVFIADKPDWYKYVSVLLDDLKQRKPYSYWYYPGFLARRFIFVLFAMVLFERPWIQTIAYF